MEKMPVFISIIFILTTLLTVYFFIRCCRFTKAGIILLSVWITGQAIISWSGFYLVTDTIPPRLVALVLPPLILIVFFFANRQGRSLIGKLDSRKLTLLHIVRIPVELCLYGLYLHHFVPGLMTFAGRNFDILSGLTAPLIWYIGFVRKRISPSLLLVWNLICLGLLIHVVADAVLSAPFPFQHYAFDQPNVAILYFPFVWLPSVIVPIVLFAHLVVIRQLIRQIRTIPGSV